MNMGQNIYHSDFNLNKSVEPTANAMDAGSAGFAYIHGWTVVGQRICTGRTVLGQCICTGRTVVG